MSTARTQLTELLAKLDREQDSERAVPMASPPTPHRRLCVGIATYDDFDGAWFTIVSALIHHPEVTDQISFVVVDNHPEGQYAAALKALETKVPAYRYVPFTGFRGTSVRDLVFREANADIVCCLDSHVLLRPGALQALLSYVDAHPGTTDLLQGPMMSTDLSRVEATHLDPVWQSGMFGRWAADLSLLGSEASEIPAHGLALFACRREAWPGFNSRFRGFGGEEGYVHERFRQRGDRVLLLPQLGWVHRFERPDGIPYTLQWADRIRNYLVGLDELGRDRQPALAHFREMLGAPTLVEPMLTQVQQQADNPLMFFGAVFCVTQRVRPGDRAHTELQLRQLGVDWRVEWVSVERDGDGGRARAAAWLQAIRSAWHRDYESLVIMDDGAEGFRFDESSTTRAAQTVAQLAGRRWSVCALDLADHSRYDGGTGPAARGSDWPAALAVHRSAYGHVVALLDRFLDHVGRRETSPGSDGSADLCMALRQLETVAPVLSPV